MRQDSVLLIVFAAVALCAVFAFIFVLGGPDNSVSAGATGNTEATGNLAGSSKIGTSWFKQRDAFGACSSGTHCNDGLPGIPTGNYDGLRELFECRCQTSDPSFTFWRSAYSWG